MIIRIIKRAISYFIDFIDYALPIEIPKIMGSDDFYVANENAEPIIVPNKLIQETFKEYSKGGVKNVYITKKYENNKSNT